MSVYPLIAFSQQPERLDFPEDQVLEANKQLDLFILDMRNTHHIFVHFTAERRLSVLRKYLGDADRSPYFWVDLRIKFKEAEKEVNRHPRLCMFCPPFQRIIDKAIDSMEYSSWGTLILKSDPPGADVFIKMSSSRNKEGQTMIKRRYPEGRYYFVVELSGYKSKEIHVSIARDNPTEEKIVLEKQ
jgi:hypothetical protein